RGWTAAMDGDLATAYSELKIAVAVAVESGIPWFECLARIGLAQQGDVVDRRAVEAQLRTAAALAERLRCPWLSYAVETAAAHAARSTGDEHATLEALRAAFRRGHELGLHQPLGWRPRPLAELCAMALNHHIEPEFARLLVRDSKLAPRA